MRMFRHWREHCLNPWNYDRFLDYAADRTILRKVGGYIFIHRLLLDHFAKMASVQKPVDRAALNWQPCLWLIAWRIALGTSESEDRGPERGGLARFP